jgi:hypothetical protein
MTIKTDELIERLARGVEPVVLLQPPWRRAAIWLVGAAAYIGLLSIVIMSSAEGNDISDAWRFLL